MPVVAGVCPKCHEALDIEVDDGAGALRGLVVPCDHCGETSRFSAYRRELVRREQSQTAGQGDAVSSGLAHRRWQFVVLGVSGLALVAVAGGLWETTRSELSVPDACALLSGCTDEEYKKSVSLWRETKPDFGYSKSKSELAARLVCGAMYEGIESHVYPEAIVMSLCLECKTHAINEAYDDSPPTPIAMYIPPEASLSEACPGTKEELERFFGTVREEKRLADVSKIEAKAYWHTMFFERLNNSQIKTLERHQMWVCFAAIIDEVYGE